MVLGPTFKQLSSSSYLQPVNIIRDFVVVYLAEMLPPEKRNVQMRVEYTDREREKRKFGNGEEERTRCVVLRLRTVTYLKAN